MPGPFATALTAAGTGFAKAAGSSLVNSLLGGKNNAPPASSYRDAAYGDIWGKVSAAKQFGIHPLYALGNPGQQAVASVGKLEADYGGLAANAANQVMRDARAQDNARRIDPLTQSQIDTNRAQKDLTEAETIETLSRIRRAEQDFNSRPMDTAIDSILDAQIVPEKMHTKVRTEKGLQSNPDLAMDLSELAGTWLDRLLHWQPNAGDFNEAVFGAWRRLGTKQYNQMRGAFKQKTGRTLPKKPARRKGAYKFSGGVK